jgi:hypothetical protein
MQYEFFPCRKQIFVFLKAGCKRKRVSIRECPCFDYISACCNMPPEIRIKKIFRDKEIKEPVEEDYKREGDYNIFFLE